ncbi:MAG: alginate export family protein [Pseudomonadales bacterium]|nr:alginate export family protein [Pseudomonadales bacterium]
MKHSAIAAGVILSALGFTGTANAEDDAFITALKSGKPQLNMRLRYEEVDIDGVTDEGQALTLRTRLGYQSGQFHGFDVMGDFEDTRIVGQVDNYAPEQAGYPVIADPEMTELNRAAVRYSGSNALEGLVATYGRQRIIYDNARFIGNVGWRQDEQTFDGTKVDYAIGDVALSGAYLTQVNTILGDSDVNMTNTLLNASWKAAPGGTLTAYAYLLETDTVPGSENDTFGLRYAGAFDLDAVKLLLTLEGAQQEVDAGDTDYYFAELGAQMAGVTVKVAQEVLGSDDGTVAFQTPLATKHAFNGWADQFLGTPAEGLEDTFVTVGGKLAGFKLAAIYHDFQSNEGSTDYGTETNLLIARPIGKNYVVGLKYADYRADDFKTDTSKYWAWAELKF